MYNMNKKFKKIVKTHVNTYSGFVYNKYLLMTKWASVIECITWGGGFCR